VTRERRHRRDRRLRMSPRYTRRVSMVNARRYAGAAFLIAAGAVLAFRTVSVINGDLDLYATLRRVSDTTDASVSETQLLDQDLYEPVTSTSTRAPRSRKQWTILIVTTSDCRGCEAAVALWQSVIVGQRDDVRVRVAAVHPGALEQDVVARMGALGIDVELWRIRDVYVFRARTGVTFAPMSVLLRDGGRVYVATSGVPSQRVRGVCIGVVHEQGGGRPGTIFEHNAQIEPIEGRLARAAH